MREAAAAVAGGLLLLFAGCTATRPAVPVEVADELKKIAILQLERGEAPSETSAGSGETDNPGPRLSPDAEAVVTAQIYGAIANDERWRLVPDLEIDEAMRSVPLSGSLADRAQALGRAAEADVVISGRVWRFQERVGASYGARYPASVGFELELVRTSTGEVLWQGSFERTQRDLSSNLLDFWMFWTAGPRWFTAAELAGLGVQQLVEEMDAALTP